VTIGSDAHHVKAIDVREGDPCPELIDELKTAKAAWDDLIDGLCEKEKINRSSRTTY
jgi:hypothetical protein